MAAYKVSVPFEPLTYETLSSSSTSQLPDSFNLPGIRVTVNAKGIYNAELRVEAPRISVAKAIAVDHVEEVLTLLATWNDGFRITFSSGVTAEKIPDEEVASVSVDESGIKHSSLHEVLELQDSISLLKKRDDVQFEVRALQWSEQWPDWLRTALKLNYLAVVSHHIVPTFIIQYSALEVLTAVIQGRSPSVLDFALEAEKAKQLSSEIKKMLRNFGLSDNGVDRLLSRISDTRAKSNIDRITDALSKCGINADPKDVRLVVQQRGAVVHAGQPSDANELRKAVSLVQNWVQIALRKIIDTRQWTFV